MTETLILHHYEESPYAEKIRLMLGLTGLNWQSLLSPQWPPRPNLDPLTGGYRRIPVAQINADIFCDTAIIAEEIARLSGQTELDPGNITEKALALMDQAESDVFFSAIAAVPPLKLLITSLKMLGPIDMIRFIKDRNGMMRKGTQRVPGAPRAKKIMNDFYQALDAHLSTQKWIGGEQPNLADFAAYHPIWLNLSCTGRKLQASKAVCEWYQRVEHIGHGKRADISPPQALRAATENEPRALPDNAETQLSRAGVQIGQSVEVAPSDYGVVPVQGKLAALTGNRIILARETTQFGTVHVHFPIENYQITAA